MAIGSTKGLKSFMDDTTDEKFELEWQIVLEEYTLIINNAITIIPLGKELVDFAGQIKTLTSENEHEGRPSNKYLLFVNA